MSPSPRKFVRICIYENLKRISSVHRIKRDNTTIIKEIPGYLQDGTEPVNTVVTGINPSIELARIPPTEDQMIPGTCYPYIKEPFSLCCFILSE